MRTRRFQFTALVVGVAAIAAACADDAPTTAPVISPTTSGPVSDSAPDAGGTTSGKTARPGTGPGRDSTGLGTGQRLRLSPFESCEALLAHVQAEAAERVGPYGLDGFGGMWPMWPAAADDDSATDFAMEAPSTVAPAAPATMPADTAAGGEITLASTNVQEAGIDEPDLVKTDGRHIVAVVGTTLHVVSTDPAAPTVVGSVRLPLAPHELVLTGDRVVAFANHYGYGGPEDILAEGDLTLPSSRSVPSTVVAEISLAEPAQPTVLATASIEGSYLSARVIDQRLRVALTSPPATLPWLYPSTPASERAAIEANRRIVAESQLEDWVPAFALDAGDVATAGPLLGCEQLHRPAEFSGFDVVTVVDLDLAGGRSALAEALGGPSPAAVGVLGGGQMVYSSHDRMYLATTAWTSTSASTTPAVTTDIHAFALDPAGPTRYVASGSVDGALLSQFSLDEHEGYLRVIVTRQGDAQNSSESRLIVLAEQGDRLETVGEVGGLGRGEQLYSVRLMGDVGFAVTFRQVDPFYVLDLSDPANPQVVGELKIPGFSTYLHPLGDVDQTGLVIGVGQDATDDGVVQGLKVSVIDVSDPATPHEVAKWTLPSAQSGAEYDHRAFQIHGSTVILPVTDWGSGFHGAIVLEVGADSVTEIGRIEHRPDGDPQTSDCRRLTADDFPEEDSSFYWDVRSGAIVQVCGPNDAGGWNGNADSCWSEDPDNRSAMFFTVEAHDAAVERLQLADDDRIEVCWIGQEPNMIERSFVIDDSIWTYGYGHLQANAVAGLGVLGQLTLPWGP